VFVTDLDTMVVNPHMSLDSFVADGPADGTTGDVAGLSSPQPGASSGGSTSRTHSVVLADRPKGFPNSGCFFVKNDAFGRTFLRRWIALETIPWLTNDNGAMAYLVLETLAERRLQGALAAESRGDTDSSSVVDSSAGREAAGLAATAAAVLQEMQQQFRGGNFTHADYVRLMGSLGASFGSRNHPNILFATDGGEHAAGVYSTGGHSATVRPFCVRWHEEGNGLSDTEEATYRAGDFMVHNKYHLKQIAKALGVAPGGRAREGG
jgi:hypothetical protein